MIPMFDAKRQVKALDGALERAAAEVLQGGWYILGRHLESFESKFAGYLGARHAAGVASGTDALKLALLAAGVKPGGKVITTPNTAIPTTMAIMDAGATPVFCDVDPDTLLIDPDLIGERIDAGTSAIIPVHLYGLAAEMDRINELAKEKELFVIEDCAQSHGTTFKGKKTGTFGHLAAFSFYPSKNLGAAGDGGMVVTDDPALHERVVLLRNYGQADRYRCVIPGVNSRLDDIQAAMLSVKLDHLEDWNARRRRIAGRYSEMFAGTDLVLPPKNEGHVYHLFVVRLSARDRLMEHLKREGVHSQVHYPIPLHLQEAFAPLGYRQGDFPVAEKAAKEALSLPMFPELTDEEVEQVGEAVLGFFRG